MVILFFKGQVMIYDIYFRLFFISTCFIFSYIDDEQIFYSIFIRGYFKVYSLNDNDWYDMIWFIYIVDSNIFFKFLFLSLFLIFIIFSNKKS